ncbi:hypothetical protein [Streptomyces canus]|uniref:hypothetical protein n=1 Tax=Streptomyces canus TaxID=58343 RepID=UPI00278B9903|nr:hypothetical protein [Streptomyces canus]MDQ1073785.1 hypothetical protein [Streptomyces canus]
MEQHTRPRQRHLQNLQKPGAAAGGEHHPGHLHQVLQQQTSALIAHRQPLHLVNERSPTTTRPGAEQPPYRQPDHDRAAADRNICQRAAAVLSTTTSSLPVACPRPQSGHATVNSRVQAPLAPRRPVCGERLVEAGRGHLPASHGNFARGQRAAVVCPLSYG